LGLVLDVERSERHFADEATGGDPSVLDRPRAPAERVGLDLTLDGGGLQLQGRMTILAKKSS
jgi:hypothetical protein